MVAFGTNLDPLKFDRYILHQTKGIRPTWCPWVRIVLRPGPGAGVTRALKSLGYRILGVIARESLSQDGVLIDQMHWADWIEGYCLNLGLDGQDAIEAGNEPDIESSSSWTMSIDDFNTLIRATVERVGGVIPVITGGLASGDPSYAAEIDFTGVSGLGLHTYTQMPAGWPPEAPQTGNWLNVLLNNYRTVTDLPFWITEFGVATQQWGARWQGRWLAKTVDTVVVVRPDVEVACQFCLDDLMVDGFGLYKAGRRKLAGQMYHSAILRNQTLMSQFRQRRRLKLGLNE